MMIKLNDGCYVAHDQIEEVRINDHATSIVVRMKNGLGHSHAPAYKQSIHVTLEQLIEKINAADKHE